MRRPVAVRVTDTAVTNHVKSTNEDRIAKRPHNSEVYICECFVLETEQGDSETRALSLLDRTVRGGKCKNITGVSNEQGTLLHPLVSFNTSINDARSRTLKKKNKENVTGLRSGDRQIHSRYTWVYNYGHLIVLVGDILLWNSISNNVVYSVLTHHQYVVNNT
jgi:hypothetical protein